MDDSTRERLAVGVWLAALAQLALHVGTSWRYGYFGDELYYLACAAHLDWGYVDHPPLSIALLAAWKSLFGTSLPALHLPAALATAGTVVLTGVLARDLGGGARAQSLAALVTALAPVNLVVGGYYSMNALDMLVWAIAFVWIVRLLESPTRGRWLALGVLFGLGLLNKISTLWLGAGLVVGLLATPRRALLRSPWPWLAGALAAAITAPYVLWQVAHGFPTAEFVRVATSQKMLPVGPVELFAQQVLAMHPFALPIWSAGLVWLFAGPERDRTRPLAIVFLVVTAILIANGTSRPNYLALAQPPLVAGGALLVERLSARPRLGWLAPNALAAIAVAGLAGAPIGVPLLRPDTLVAYQTAIGIEAPRMERHELAGLPQHFADMYGWPELVAALAEVRDRLDPAERERARILVPSYSDAGAVDLLGPALGLPPAISGHNSYWLWGPGDATGDVLIVLGYREADLRPVFDELVRAGETHCTWCMPGRNQSPIWLARGLREPLADLWPRLRHYD